MFIVSILLSLLFGFSLVWLLLRNNEIIYSNIIFSISLSLGIGLGISSVLFFVWLLVFEVSDKWYILTEVCAGLIVIFILMYNFSFVRVANYVKKSNLKFSMNSLNGFFMASFFISIIIFFVIFILLSLEMPYGLNDSYAIWNKHARFLYACGSQIRNALPYFVQPAYPLLLPNVIARSWVYIGTETVIAPIIIAGIFSFTTVALVSTSLFILRSKAEGLLAGMLILGTHYFNVCSASQYADIPLGFFYVTTIMLLVMNNKYSGNGVGLIVLAGMSAGFAGWTKDEGLLFIISILIAHLLSTLLCKGVKVYIKEIRWFLIGLIPVLIIIYYFKTYFAPDRCIYSAQGLLKIVDVSRYIIICKSLLCEIFYYKRGIVNPFIIGLIYLFFVGLNINKKSIIQFVFPLITLVLMGTGYFCIYLITPVDLQWHLDTSLTRLFIQLWPCIVFCFFLIVRPVEQAIIESRKV